MTDQDKQPVRIAFLLGSLAGGGAEKVILDLAGGFAAAGYSVDLLVGKMKGALQNRIPPDVNVISLRSSSSLRGVISACIADPGCLVPVAGLLARTGRLPGTFKSMPAIIDYLRARQPVALLSALQKSNVNAVLAGRYCGGATRVVVGIHTNYSAESKLDRDESRAVRSYKLSMIRRSYRRADAVVAVSKGAEKDICDYLGLPREQVTSVYNPIATRSMRALCEEVPQHSWFEPGRVPVILGIGRFVTEKDFPLLLDAFARVRRRREVRLVLLGGDMKQEGQRRLHQELQAQAVRLGVASDVDMPGFAENPSAFLSRAAVFVLSSRYEGFGNVLVEAMLCGCPVVSTDCPSGPAEILQDGKFGELVPVGDAGKLADAIGRTLDAPPEKDVLRARGAEFSVENAVAAYSKIFLPDSMNS